MSVQEKAPLVPVTSPPVFAREAVLTAEQAAAGLQVSRRQFSRLDMPVVYLGDRTPRYLWGQVLDHLAERTV